MKDTEVIGAEAKRVADDDLTATELHEKLDALRDEHRRLGDQIDALQLQDAERFQILALKRKKLKLKDEIAWVTAQITPDIIA